jgi:hypothetical protein
MIALENKPKWVKQGKEKRLKQLRRRGKEDATDVTEVNRCVKHGR